MGEVFASHYTPGIHHAAWSPVDWWYPATGGGTQLIRFTVNSVTTPSGGPYAGLKVATVTIDRVAPCSLSSLIGTSVEVVDESECVFDIANADLIDKRGWATQGITTARDGSGLTPCTWFADDLCC